MVSDSDGLSFNRFRGSSLVESARWCGGANLDYRLVRSDNGRSGGHFWLSVAQLADTGDIINRVVVKDCDFNQNEDTRDNWENDPSLFGQNDDGRKVPTEVLTMFDLRGKQGSEYIVKILNWRIASKRRLYRLYLEVSSSGEQATIQITNGLAVCRPSQETSENLVTSYRSITTLKLWVD